MDARLRFDGWNLPEVLKFRSKIQYPNADRVFGFEPLRVSLPKLPKGGASAFVVSGGLQAPYVISLRTLLNGKASRGAVLLIARVR